MMEQLDAKSAEKDALVALLAELVAQLPGESEERGDLQDQVEQLNKRWTAISEGLSQHESNLEAAFMLAKGHEGAMAKLLPWVPTTTERLENLGPPPSEPEQVEKLKAEIEVSTTLLLYIYMHSFVLQWYL
jgi:chromosome segregation ATPase